MSVEHLIGHYEQLLRLKAEGKPVEEELSETEEELFSAVEETIDKESFNKIERVDFFRRLLKYEGFWQDRLSEAFQNLREIQITRERISEAEKSGLIIDYFLQEGLPMYKVRKKEPMGFRK